MIGVNDQRPYIREPAAISPDVSTPLGQWYLSTSGIRPSRMFLGDSLNDLAAPSGAPVTLVTLNSPEYQLAQTAVNASALMTESYRFQNVVEAWEVADTSYGNVGLDSVSVDILFRTSFDGFPGSAGALGGKREPGGSNVGREVILGTDGKVTVNASDGANKVISFDQYNAAIGQHLYADAQWHWVSYRLNRETGLLEAATEHEPTMTAAIPAGSVDTATRWRIGGVRAFAAPVEVALVVECEGIQCTVDNLYDRATRLSLETNAVFSITHR